MLEGIRQRLEGLGGRLRESAVTRPRCRLGSSGSDPRGIAATIGGKCEACSASASMIP